MLIRFLILILLFAKAGLSFSSTVCEKKLMKAYLENRDSLLSSDFSSKAVLSTLRPAIDTVIKRENLNGYLVALRIQEAKIIKIYEYAAHCDEDGGVIKIKILYLNGEYDRLKVFVKNYKDKPVIYSSSLEVSNEIFDKSQQYEPFVSKDFYSQNSSSAINN